MQNKKTKLYMLIERIIKEETDPKQVVLDKYPDAVCKTERGVGNGPLMYVIYTDSKKSKWLDVGSSEAVAWKYASKKV